MEKEPEETEKAFLCWLNSLGVSQNVLVSLAELKDGIVLSSLLSRVDKDKFPLTEIVPHPATAKECLSNLAVLTKSIEIYLGDCLSLPLAPLTLDPAVFGDAAPEMTGVLCELVLPFVPKFSTSMKATQKSQTKTKIRPREHWEWQ